MIGLLAIVTGLVFNDLTFTFFMTPNVWASLATRASLWILDVVLLLGGLVLVKRSNVEWAFNVGLAVVTTVAFVMLVEGACGSLNAFTRPSDVAGGDFFARGQRADPRLGTKLLPNVHVSHSRTFDGRTTYDVHYTTDDRGRRMTPQANPAAREAYLLFFGCSFTFGLGVEDDQTLPAEVAAAAPRHHAYNYALGGYGSHQMLAQLRDDALRSEIPEPTGLAVYTFIDHHVDRVSGKSDAAWGAHWDGPYFSLDDDGRLVDGGGFRWGRPVRSFINYAVSRSHTARFVRRSFPPVTDASFDLTAQVIVAARDAYVAKFGNDAFYVVFYPRSFRAAAMIARLENAGVKTLDYSQLFEGRGKEVYLPSDSHPSAVGNRVVAERLVADLGIGAGVE